MLPLLKASIPGLRSIAAAKELRRYESRNVTYVGRDWPIFWTRARGTNVWDVDGNRYLDLTAAFGVASLGHNNPRVTAAAHRQLGQLVHGLGDVHPNELKVRLARQLVELTFGRWLAAPHPDPLPKGEREQTSGVAGNLSPLPRKRERVRVRAGGDARVIFCNSGSEAVEAALKTAMLATGKRGVIAFKGAYHGLTYGALDVTAWPFFRKPFQAQLGGFTVHVEMTEASVRAAFRGRNIGAIIVEPILGRGGVVVPQPDFLPMLRRVCDDHGALLIADEMFTGFCRTGRWFAVEHWKVVPDVICVGKAMSNGFPISACVGQADVMDAWPENRGEALHTSTHLGSPLGCAMALATIAEMKRLKLDERSFRLCDRLQGRGIGLMKGIPLPNAAACERVVKRLLQRGVIALSGGEKANVLTLTPPLTISERELDFAAEEVGHAIACHL